MFASAGSSLDRREMRSRGMFRAPVAWPIFHSSPVRTSTNTAPPRHKLNRLRSVNIRKVLAALSEQPHRHSPIGSLRAETITWLTAGIPARIKNPNRRGCWISNPAAVAAATVSLFGWHPPARPDHSGVSRYSRLDTATSTDPSPSGRALANPSTTSIGTRASFAACSALVRRVSSGSTAITPVTWSG